MDGVIVNGYLAGHNAARAAFGKELLALPRTLAIGDFMAFVAEKFESGEALKPGVTGYRMARGEYWDRMQKLGLYTADIDAIKTRVEDSGLAGVLVRSLA